jgi:hypothetical protein
MCARASHSAKSIKACVSASLVDATHWSSFHGEVLSRQGGCSVLLLARTPKETMVVEEAVAGVAALERDPVLPNLMVPAPCVQVPTPRSQTDPGP